VGGKYYSSSSDERLDNVFGLSFSVLHRSGKSHNLSEDDPKPNMLERAVFEKITKIEEAQ
jgi:hypothetical protein